MVSELVNLLILLSFVLMIMLQSVGIEICFDAIFFDFSKAFEKIPHDVLVSPLCSHGMSGSFLRWIRDFLSRRQQRVRTGSSLSCIFPVISGI